MLTYTFEAQLNSPELRSAMSLLSVSPLYASSGLVKLVQFLAMGATAVIEPDFDAERTLDILTRDKIEVFSGVPIFYEQIAACRGFADADLSNLKFCSVAGARVPASLLGRGVRGGVIVRQGYGLSEGSNTTVNSAENAIAHPSSAAPAASSPSIASCVPTARTASRRRTGEIWLRGPSMMQGYWNNPEATRTALVDGWLKTGDVGMMDERGQITFVDRLKDLIISGGLNISPLDVEGAISDLDGVAEVAVIGVPDPVFALETRWRSSSQPRRSHHATSSRTAMRGSPTTRCRAISPSRTSRCRGSPPARSRSRRCARNIAMPCGR